jgi:hypothetical protein
MKDHSALLGVTFNPGSQLNVFLRVQTSKGALHVPLTAVDDDDRLIFNWVIHEEDVEIHSVQSFMEAVDDDGNTHDLPVDDIDTDLGAMARVKGGECGCFTRRLSAGQLQRLRLNEEKWDLLNPA